MSTRHYKTTFTIVRLQT
uniref:Uncharacterized protein n=1 Tax=Arundo donax TaxID=35708 RepID=A0A0A9AVK3_ARUDO